MAAFVGYLVGASGLHFPWNLQGPLGLAVPEGTPTISFADISAAGGPADQWDALPSAAKLQIIGAIGFLEVHARCSRAQHCYRSLLLSSLRLDPVSICVRL